MLLKEEERIFELLKEYVAGKISQREFVGSYSQLLPQLESELEEGLYHPLNVIVPTDDNSDSGWKDDMRNMYLREIENLDKLEDEPSYAEKLTVEQQKELCHEAIDFIPKAALDRSSKEWIEETLIEDDEFVFVNEQGKSNFARCEILYKAKLVRKSFIMSAFSGGACQNLIVIMLY